jgi:hypothetical protein
MGGNSLTTMMDRWLTNFGEKTDHFAIGYYRPDLDLRPMMKTLHPELVERYLRQFSAELSFLRGIDLPVPSADGCLLLQRIVEGEDSAPRHFPIPCLAGAPRTGENVRLSSRTKSARTMQKRRQYENLEELAAYA